MAAVALITFDYSCAPEEVKALALDFAENVKPTIAGLTWKIFLDQPAPRRAAGVYLFQDRQAAQDYVDGRYVQGLRAAPIVSNLSAEVFDTLDEASAKAGAPL